MSLWLEFGLDLFRFGAVAALLSAPAVVVGLRKGQSHSARRFLVTGGLVATGCALVSLVSAALVHRCADAGNTGCIDVGAAGVQVLALGVYGVVSITRAVAMARW